jgi:hypothetical protein
MSKSRRMRSAWHVARMGPQMNPYRIRVGNLGRKRQVGRARRRWFGNMNMDPR